MTKTKLERQLHSLTGADSSFPFGSDALVFKVMGKMFALVSQNETPPRVTLKCAPADAEVLVAEYETIDPGYYMNKRHWITIRLSSEVPDEMLVDLAVDSYERVVSKLSKADKAALRGVKG